MILSTYYLQSLHRKMYQTHSHLNLFRPRSRLDRNRWWSQFNFLSLRQGICVLNDRDSPADIDSPFEIHVGL